MFFKNIRLLITKMNIKNQFKKVINIMETWYYDTNTYYYNLEYGESLVYDIWDFEIR